MLARHVSVEEERSGPEDIVATTTDTLLTLDLFFVWRSVLPRLALTTVCLADREECLGLAAYLMD
jgi:hypothetical protein